MNVSYASGHMVFAIGSTLYAQPFDTREPQLLGSRWCWRTMWCPRPNNSAGFAVSQAGSLVYAPQAFQRTSRLLRMARDGRTLESIGEPADYSNVRVLAGRTPPVGQCHGPRPADARHLSHRPRRGIRQRLTFDPTDERSAVWNPDGRRIIFFKGRTSLSAASDFTGGDDPVQTDGVSKDPQDVSADGRSLLFRRSGGANDLWVMPLDGDRTPKPLLNSPVRRELRHVLTRRGLRRLRLERVGPVGGVRRLAGRDRWQDPR